MARIEGAARINGIKPEQQAVSGTAIAAGDATGSQTLPARKPYRINPLLAGFVQGLPERKESGERGALQLLQDKRGEPDVGGGRVGKTACGIYRGGKGRQAVAAYVAYGAIACCRHFIRLIDGFRRGFVRIIHIVLCAGRGRVGRMVLRLEPWERVKRLMGLGRLGSLSAKRHDGGQRTLQWQPQHDQNNDKQPAPGLHAD
jgi:hypothetical protein